MACAGDGALAPWKPGFIGTAWAGNTWCRAPCTSTDAYVLLAYDDASFRDSTRGMGRTRQCPDVARIVGLEANEQGPALAKTVYGARFDFESGMRPGYVGDLFVLNGDALGEPLVLTRDDTGHLQVV